MDITTDWFKAMLQASKEIDKIISGLISSSNDRALEIEALEKRVKALEEYAYKPARVSKKRNEVSQ